MQNRNAKFKVQNFYSIKRHSFKIADMFVILAITWKSSWAFE